MQHTLVCLHGWGGSSESFDELRNGLQGSELRVLSPDLPGFGNQPDPEKPWTVQDYALWTAAYIGKNVQGPYSLLGHSHGGRIAIKLTTSVLKETNTPLPQHLYLCAAAGIRHPRHAKRLVGFILAKAGKWILALPGMRLLQPLGKKCLYKLMRVHDYEKASRVMQHTLIQVSNEDLRPLLSSIHIPTDIFWGEQDTMTPLSDGKIMQKEIPKSTLHTFPNVRHRIHRDKAQEIAHIILTHTVEH